MSNHELDQLSLDVIAWKEKKSPELYTDILVKSTPLMRSAINSYKTTGSSHATLMGVAQAQMCKSIMTYDPSKGSNFSTHLSHNLKKVQRFAINTTSSGKVPENRLTARSTFTGIKNHLEDMLGREPNEDELADELGWSSANVARMQNEMSGEMNRSKSVRDYTSDLIVGEDSVIADYVYFGLSPEDKLIFEYSTGKSGKPLLNNKQIASKLGKNEMYVTRRRAVIGEKILNNR